MYMHKMYSLTHVFASSFSQGNLLSQSVATFSLFVNHLTKALINTPIDIERNYAK